MSAKHAVARIDYGQIISKLGLTGQTANSLLAFHRRNEAAKLKVAQLAEQPTKVDFDYYKSVLKNQKVVDEIKQSLDSFKPVTYDVSKQLKTIETFEACAVKNAEETETKVAEELTSLKKTLENIEGARAFEDLVVEDILNAAPEIDDKVREFVQKGIWEVPGYEEKFGNTVLM